MARNFCEHCGQPVRPTDARDARDSRDARDAHPREPGWGGYNDDHERDTWDRDRTYHEPSAAPPRGYSPQGYRNDRAAQGSSRSFDERSYPPSAGSGQRSDRFAQPPPGRQGPPFREPPPRDPPREAYPRHWDDHRPGAHETYGNAYDRRSEEDVRSRN